MKPQTGGLGFTMPSQCPVTMHRWGEFRPPGRQNPAFVGLCSQDAPLEPREPGLSKNWVNTAFSLGTHLISSGVRGRRAVREKGMDGGAERKREEIQLRHCTLLETLPAAHSRKWPPQLRLHRDPKLGPDLLGNELLTATPTPAPVQPPGSLLRTHIAASPFWPSHPKGCPFLLRFLAKTWLIPMRPMTLRCTQSFQQV